MIPITVDVNEVIAVLKNQRNTALDEVAIQVARVADIQKKVKELEEKLQLSLGLAASAVLSEPTATSNKPRDGEAENDGERVLQEKVNEHHG